MKNLANHIYIFATIFFTVASQIIMRWQVSTIHSGLPVDFIGKLIFIKTMLLKPWVLLAVMCTFLAGISWMMAMTKFEVSYAYLWVSLNFILVMFFGITWFQESISLLKIIGTCLVLLGLFVATRG